MILYHLSILVIAHQCLVINVLKKLKTHNALQHNVAKCNDLDLCVICCFSSVCCLREEEEEEVVGTHPAVVPQSQRHVVPASCIIQTYSACSLCWLIHNPLDRYERTAQGVHCSKSFWVH